MSEPEKEKGRWPQRMWCDGEAQLFLDDEEDKRDKDEDMVSHPFAHQWLMASILVERTRTLTPIH